MAGVRVLVYGSTTCRCSKAFHVEGIPELVENKAQFNGKCAEQKVAIQYA